MKKRFLYGALGLLTLGALAACSSEEDQLKEQNNQTMEYQLSVDINDLDTRSGETTPPDWLVDGEDPAEIDDCPEISEIDDMVAGNFLYANVNVDYGYGTHPLGLDTEMFTLKLEKFGSKLIMEPMILPIGTHQILSVEIMHNQGTPSLLDDKMMFAAVGNTSKYKNFVPFAHLMPMTFTLDPETDKYQKVEDPITVLCAVNAQAEDFGFEKWNTNFVKVYCIPFLVNRCDPENGHTVVSTRAEVYKRCTDKKDKNYQKPEKEAIYISDLAGATGMNTFCISDDKSIADEDEYYYVVIKDQTGDVLATYEGNVADLKDPKNHPLWDATYNFIHFFIDECTACEGYPNATTWAGETFKDKDIKDLLEDGWENLVAPESYGKKHHDYIKNGDLYIARTWNDRCVYTPVFYIAEAGKFCVEYPSEFSDEHVSIELVKAETPTMEGRSYDYLFGGQSHCCQTHDDCVNICEPGCYRVKITVKCGIIPVALKEVTLTRMESCRK